MSRWPSLTDHQHLADCCRVCLTKTVQSGKGTVDYITGTRTTTKPKSDPNPNPNPKMYLEIEMEEEGRRRRRSGGREGSTRTPHQQQRLVTLELAEEETEDEHMKMRVIRRSKKSEFDLRLLKKRCPRVPRRKRKVGGLTRRVWVCLFG